MVDHIGRGGMADVWAAEDTRLKRMVAIKTITRSLTGEANILARFEDEAQTIAELEHPHILPVYSFGNVGNELYIVMRYVSGGTLSDRLRGGALPVEEVLRIGSALAAALDYAHGRHIAHLDLKPANILMDAQALPYLADFGLSRRFDPEFGTKLTASSGTLDYMAPEQACGDYVDARADVFSLGVLLYQMFTGEIPFGLGTPTAFMILSNRILPDPRDRAPDLPESVAGVLRDATRLKAIDRYASAGALIAALTDTFTVPASALEWHDLPDDEDADLELLEARRLFHQARFAWRDGTGKFALSMVNFRVVNTYYRPGRALGDEVEAADRQFMLRGAIEYAIDIAPWQAQVASPEVERAVCLHALRSGIPGARVRAVALLTDLLDADPPVIVRRVAHELGAETHAAVRGASIALMAVRAPASETWRPAAYTHAIDERLAEQALKPDAQVVSDSAAHAVGKLRSIAGVEHFVKHRAFDALVLVRDAAPDLPPSLPRDLRWRVFMALSWRKLDPQAMTLRFVTAAVGGMVGMGGIVFTIYPYHQPLFLPARLLNTIGVGVPVGLFVGLMALLTVEVPGRLERLWAWWVRVLLFWLLGALSILPAFVYYHMGYLNRADPAWPVLAAGSVVIAGALMLGASAPLPVWARVLLGAASTGGAMLVTHHLFLDGRTYDPLITVWNTTQAQTLSLLLGIASLILVIYLRHHTPKRAAGSVKLNRLP